MANYDNAALFYDRLSQLVFGKALIDAQVYYLPQIPQNCNVLIVGGGTGWILEEIARIHPGGLTITYVEISGRMMALSSKRNTGDNRVSFINKAISDVELKDQDVVITPFLFDNFKEENLPPMFDHIRRMLKADGIWINTDFQLTGKWWQHIILKSMLLFFKILCGVESWRLPNAGAQFNKFGFSKHNEKTFFKDFVVTRVYRK